LFVEALVRGLLDSGVLVRSKEGWALADDRSRDLPRGVRDLVVDRLDLLSSDERSAVELIAHGAQGLPHGILEAAGGLQGDQLLGVIGNLVGAGLVIQEEDGSEVIYRLSHPLIQEVAAAELPAVAGRRLHARLARMSERLRPRDLDRLAYHYSRAGGEVDADRALDVLLEAGERAHGLAAHDEAARHFGAALTLIRDGRRMELVAQVLERLGESWEPVGEIAAAMEVWAEALDEHERAGDAHGIARLHRRLGMAARSLGDVESTRKHLAAGIEALRDLPPSEELVDIYHARLLVDSPLNDPDRAEDAVADLARIAQLLSSPRAAAGARIAEGWLCWGRGEYESSRASMSEALQIAEESGEWLLAQRAQRELAWVGFLLAEPDIIRSGARSLLEMNRRVGTPADDAIARLQLGYAALLTGDWNEACLALEEAVTSARRYDQKRYLAMCLGVLALVRTSRGDLDAAEECLAEARQAFPITADTRGPLYLVGLAEAMLALERGDAAAVRQAAGRLQAPFAQVMVGMAQVETGDLEGALATAWILAAEGRPGSYPAALADRIVGLVEHAQGETEAAGEHLERSAEALAALGLPFEAAISQLHLGTAEGARQALATFEALGATRYAERARRMLRGLGVRLPSPRSGRDRDQRLSRRELEVARLVADGFTNAEIAGRLVLSVRTVESHLDHIYGRLGISSRASLATWVAASGETSPIT
jgi:ATP/maltotriose-dependent transcriptional regulator MalT